jgi:peptidase E
MNQEVPAFLMAGGGAGSRSSMIHSLAAALNECGKPKPKVAYLGVASKDNKIFFTAIKSLLQKAGAYEVKLLHLAKENADIEAAKKYHEAADAIFISGGEVEDGMVWLVKHGLDRFLKELYHQGKLFIGMSAGSIMMGTHWVRWEKPGDDTTAELFNCLAFIPTVFDTHAEDEDWIELKTALRLLGSGSQGFGIPLNGMIRADSQGKLVNLEKTLLPFINGEGQVRRV